MGRRRKREKSSPSNIISRSQSVSKKHKTLTSTDVSDETDSDTDSIIDFMDTPSTSTMSAPVSKFTKADLNEVADIITNRLKSQLFAEIKTEITSIVQAEMAKFTKEISTLRTENSTLQQTIKTLEMELDELDQYGRRMCLELSNIPGDTGDFGENVESKLLDLAKSTSLPITPSDIDRCHRLGKPKLAVNRRIIVKFSNSKARQRVYDARKTLGDGIFFQEHLTRLRGQLAYEARQLSRAKKLTKTLVAGGKVYGLKMDRGKEVKFLFRHMDDIVQLRDGTP